MIKVSRNEAAAFCAFLKLSTLSPEEYRDVRETVLLENGLDPESPDDRPSDISFLIRRYFELEFAEYTNRYLTGCLQLQFQSAVEVFGKEPKLHPCNCCGYLTIDKPGQYSICKVCFWEDDGTNEDSRYSGPNKMTLGEAKEHFAQLGAMSTSCLSFLGPDRTERFHFNPDIQIKPAEQEKTKSQQEQVLDQQVPIGDLLSEKIDTIKSREQFVEFVELLLRDLKKNPQEWENQSLDSFLEALSRWTEDMDGYYQNMQKPYPPNINWRVFAQMLMAAKIYE